MASLRWILSLLILGTSAIAAPHDNLRNKVVRKQRSLDATDSPEYYNDLHSFKYHGGDTDHKFDRDFDEDEEEIEFLPSDNGQLETVGEGFQSLNNYNKLIEWMLNNYLASSLPEQDEPMASIFRERERSASRKRGSAGDRLNLNDRELTKLLLKELQDGSAYDSFVELDSDDLNALQSLYDRYRAGRGNKVYETAGPMSWGELLSKGLLKSETKDGNDDEFMDRDEDQGLLYLPAERRNVNGRFPIGREFGSYRKLTKRYPVAKRSPKPIRLKTTDPKVAQDLGALFGTQSIMNSHNHTHKSDHEHDHKQEPDQNHDHDHKYEPNQNHDHDHEHEVAQDLGALFGTQSIMNSYNHKSDHEHDHKQEPDQNHDHDHKYEPNQNHDHEHEVKTEVPKVKSPKGQKENVTKTSKSKFVQVRKKSVDWSQYFGIDRRKKKATFTAGQDTQNQDDEWMLQRYYENMAENLKPKDDQNERKDNLEVDTTMKYIKKLILQEAAKYAALEDEAELQKVKDKLMSEMIAAYSLQKMQKALSELRNNVAAQKEAQKIHKENNFTSNFRENSNNNPSINSGTGGKIDDKRCDNNIEESESIEESSCPELEAIEGRCRNLAGDTIPMFYVPCVKLQICKACAQDEDGLLPCLANYAVEAGKICDTLDPSKDGQQMVTRQSCANTALLLSQVRLPASATAQCRARNSCLWRYHARYEHRFRTSPAYEGTGHRHHEGALDMLQQTMSER